MNIRIVIVDVSGEQWASDSEEVTKEDLYDIQDLFENFGNLINFKIPIGGNLIYFNPRNIVAMWWEEVDE